VTLRSSRRAQRRLPRRSPWVLAVAVALAAPAGASIPGAVDDGYRAGSRVTTDFAGAEDGIAALIAQPDGTVVAAGSARVPHSEFALVRYRPDGNLDPGFGDHGKVTTRIGSGALIQAAARQPDGKLIAAGVVDFSANGGPIDFALARYLADGRLDRSFGDAGIVVTDISPGASDVLHAVVLQPDGRIVVAGDTPTGGLGDTKFVLARYLPDGRLDPTFGQDGIVTTDLGQGIDSARGLVLQPDGRLVTVGHGGTGAYPVAVRYLPDGSLDPTFGRGGRVTMAGPMTGAMAAALQPDGRIVVAGNANGTNPALAVARLLADGTPDTSFGDDGQVVTAVGWQANADAVIVQSNGRIAVAGAADIGKQRGQFAFLVARYEPDGVPDRSFGRDGVATTDFTPGTDEATALAVDASGHLVAGGVSGFTPPGRADFAVVGLDRPLVAVDVPVPAPVSSPGPVDRLAPIVPATLPHGVGAAVSLTVPVPVTGPFLRAGVDATIRAATPPGSVPAGSPPAATGADAPGPASTPAAVEPAPEQPQTQVAELSASLRYSPAGRATPRPPGPNGPLVLLAAVLIAVVGTANVTLRHVRRAAANQPN
jgi:uncharacterized delta-60 repeat protein